MRVHAVSLVDRAAVRDPSNPTEPQKFLLWKSESREPQSGDNQPQEEATMTPEEMAAALAKAEQERDTAVAKSETLETRVADLEKAAKPAEVSTEINKSELPDAVRAALEKAEGQNEELRKAATEATELAKAERDLRVQREFIAKAESDYSHVSGDTNTFGKVLKSASEKLSKEDFDTLTAQLDAAESRIAKGELFREVGLAGQPTAERTDSLSKAEDKAAELRKADSSLSAADALRQAMRDPELAAAYRAEQIAA
jgi:chromosome segregation ATPase